MKLRDPAPLLSDLAYERILEAVFERRVPMGGRLNQTALVELTGIPVGPVRDALKMLEADGVVKVHPRSGIEMIRPSAELVRSTFQFRIIIEGPAVRHFALIGDEERIRAILEQHRSARERIAALPPGTDVADDISGLEIALHIPVVASLDNELVDASYRRLQLMARIVKLRTSVFVQPAAVSIREHEAVLEAALNRDPDAAEAAMLRHLGNAMNRNLGL